MTITALPTPPTRSDPATFAARGDAFMTALPTFVAEANALAATVSADQATASTAASNASASQSAAASSASAASTSAATATTKASEASASASAASTSATNASNSAASASSSASAASTSAATATTKASEASASAAAASAIVLGVSTTLPVLRPTLNLDFANSLTVDSRITFTRASTATRYNAKGLLESVASGVPRIDYDPETLACKGLLIEESRTNLLTYSEQFNNAAWTKTRASITANAVTAPDGTTTADKLVEDATASATHLAFHASVAVTAQAYTITVYAKADTRSVLQIVPDGTNFPVSYANFDLSVGTVSASSGVDSTSITAVGGGWYRCVVVDTATSAVTTNQFYLYLQNSPTAARGQAYTGDGTSGIYIWGAQLEAGAFPTSYIPTTSAQVTRAADAASMTGTNFSNWYRQDGFSAVCKFVGNASGTRTYAAWSDSTATEAVLLQSVAGALAVTVVDGGVTQASLSLGSVASGTAYTVALAWTLNDFAASINGAAVVADASGTLPTLSQINLAGDNAGANPSCGALLSIRGYPKRLTNAELQALTA